MLGSCKYWEELGAHQSVSFQPKKALGHISITDKLQRVATAAAACFTTRQVLECLWGRRQSEQAVRLSESGLLDCRSLLSAIPAQWGPSCQSQPHQTRGLA